MKKLVILFYLFFWTSPVLASTIGNVETADKGKISLGINNDFLFDRRLEADTWELHENLILNDDVEFFDSAYNISKPRTTHQHRTTGKVSYGLLKDLEVNLTLGTGQQKIQGYYEGSGAFTFPAFGVIGRPSITHDGIFTHETENSFVYGGGFKLTQKLHDEWLLGCNIQYLREDSRYKATRHEILEVPSLSAIVNFTKKWEGTLTTQEWSIAPYLAKKIYNFTPYIGFVYTYYTLKDRARLPVSISGDANDGPILTAVDSSPVPYNLEFRSRFSYGALVGLNWQLNDRWMLNFEGRFFDELALSVEGLYRF